MKIIFGPRKTQSLLTVSILLVALALMAGMAGCGPVQYNLTISSTEGGEVTTPGEGTFTYDEGTVVNLTAEADEGYQFVNWTGNVSAIADVNADATTITMNGDYSITANFAIAIEIWDWYELDAVRDNLAGNYTLMNDLDSNAPGYEELASPTANEVFGWQPIGTEDNLFTGTFDGQGYEIRDLFINRPSESYVGLFGAVNQSGGIKNIGVTNATVIGEDAVGGLVGVCYGTVTNSYSTGSVTSEADAGGLVGWNQGIVSNSYATCTVIGGFVFVGGLVGVNDGTVTNSYSTGSVTGYGQCIGGLVGGNGYSSPGTVSNSYSTGRVTGEDDVGGLVGANWPEGIVSDCYAAGNVDGEREVGGLVGGNDGTVTDSYSTGNVTGEADAGGLVGGNHDIVSNSYSTGSVTGNSSVGGLVGLIDEGNVSNSYSTGNVTGVTHVGGLVGWNEEGTVSNSFWDIETSGQATSAGGTGKNTTEMKNIDTFTDTETEGLDEPWDMTTVANPGERNPAYIWNIVNNVTYPFLSWQPV